MSRDQGPQDTLTTGNGGNVITDGECLPRELPQPTDAQNLFDSLDDLVLAARWPAFTLALIFLAMSAGYFFNR